MAETLQSIKATCERTREVPYDLLIAARDINSNIRINAARIQFDAVYGDDIYECMNVEAGCRMKAEALDDLLHNMDGAALTGSDAEKFLGMLKHMIKAEASLKETHRNMLKKTDVSKDRLLSHASY